MKKLNKAWITINRSCNLRCRWCYAANTEYKQSSDMDFNLACELFDLFSDIGINDVSLLGGEPTCYSYLLDLLSYAKNKNITCHLITNGIALSNIKYLSEIVNLGIGCIDISLKGFSVENYIAETGYDGYSQTMNAIKNLELLGTEFIVSMVLTYENITEYIRGITDAVNNGAKNFRFSFCHDFSALDTEKINLEYPIKKNVFDVIDGFKNSYEELRKITNDNFSLHQTFPLCAWDFEFVKLLQSRNQIFSSCQVFTREGVIFDTQGYIIPCNLMHQVKLGKWKQEFSNYNEFLNFWNGDMLSNYYNAIANQSIPSETCKSQCEDWELCGGGCLSNWYNYTFNKFQGDLEIYRHNN